MNKELTEKMINHYCFTDRALQVGLNKSLEFGIEPRYINKILKESSSIYDRLLNQYKFNYQSVFSAKLDEQGEDNQVLDETELYINLNTNHILTEIDLHNINVRFNSEKQIQNKK